MDDVQTLYQVIVSLMHMLAVFLHGCLVFVLSLVVVLFGLSVSAKWLAEKVGCCSPVERLTVVLTGNIVSHLSYDLQCTDWD